jgi:hypothetical protein
MTRLRTRGLGAPSIVPSTAVAVLDDALVAHAPRTDHFAKETMEGDVA